MKTYKILLTKHQNNLLAARAKVPEIKVSCQFSGMAQDYSMWVNQGQLDYIGKFLGEQAKALPELNRQVGILKEFD